jgi:hypothetical protein
MQRSFCCLASDDSSNQHDQQGHDQKDEKEGVFQGELHTGSPFGSYARFFFEGSCILSYHRKDWNGSLLEWCLHKAKERLPFQGPKT